MDDSSQQIIEKEVNCLGFHERYKKAERERCQYRSDY